LAKKSTAVIKHPEQAILAALEHPIGCGPLATQCGPGKSACVVVSDITRPVPNHIILPVLLKHLEANGVRRPDITILIATGMHRPVEGEELVELLGKEIVDSYKIENHNPDRESALEHMGFTTQGIEIKVNKIYAQSDLKILTGLIEPHFMAGYSGGRKSICPGIASLESLRFSHGIECLEHDSAMNCVLPGNPFHDEALEAARAAGCDFIVNVVLDEDRAITGVFAGDMEAAHHAGCEFVDRHFKARISAPAEIVLTSNAGYPLDINFYQTVKGLVGALPAVAEGGTIIIASRCPEALGSEGFFSLLEELKAANNFQDFLDTHKENFVPEQWQVQKLIHVLKKARFMIYSEGLTKEQAELGFGEKIDSIEQGLELAFSRHSPDARVIVIPEGPYVVPEIA
jgi:lactate racemase